MREQILGIYDPKLKCVIPVFGDAEVALGKTLEETLAKFPIEVNCLNQPPYRILKTPKPPYIQINGIGSAS